LGEGRTDPWRVAGDGVQVGVEVVGRVGRVAHGVAVETIGEEEDDVVGRVQFFWMVSWYSMVLFTRPTPLEKMGR